MVREGLAGLFAEGVEGTKRGSGRKLGRLEENGGGIGIQGASVGVLGRAQGRGVGLLPRGNSTGCHILVIIYYLFVMSLLRLRGRRYRP